MRNFTKYPSSYIKASTSQDELEKAILDITNGTNEYSPGYKIEDFTNLVYYMSGYAPDATLRDFIEAYRSLQNKGLIKTPSDW